MGVIYLNKRLFDYAKEEFELAYQYDPENYAIVLEYANYLHSTSNFEKADEMYQKAVELAPENPNALAFSALNKTHLKQIDKAMEQINKAMKNLQIQHFYYLLLEEFISLQVILRVQKCIWLSLLNLKEFQMFKTC